MGTGSRTSSVMKPLFVALVVLPLYCMGFIGGGGGGGSSISSGLRSSGSLSVSRLKAESGDGGGAQVSAKELSKGFSHPPSVFTVDKDIARILPHRYPFALVDKVIHFEPGKRAIGIKCITNNEPQFTGHFPDRPIMPGVLQVEAMAQLCGIIALQQPISDGRGTFFFGGVNGVKWKKPVTPGDVLVMEVELIAWKEQFGMAKCSGKAYVDGVLALDVKELTFALVKEKD